MNKVLLPTAPARRPAGVVIGALCALLMLAVAGLAGGASAALADVCPNAQVRVGPSASVPDCRAYELVTPADKANGRGIGNYFPGDAAAWTGVPSSNGDRLLSVTANNVLSDPAFSFAYDYNLHERTATGWVTRPAVTRPSYSAGGGIGADLEPTTVSGDLSTQAWTGQLRAFVFPEMADWPNTITASYLRDWGSAWSVMAPQAPEQKVANAPGINTSAISGDGHTVVLSSSTRNLLGPDDPSQDQQAGTLGGQTLYLTDTSTGVPDGFAAVNPRTANVGICTGTGTDRTELPSRTADATPLQAARPCPDGPAGRPGLISSAGASIAMLGASNVTTKTNALSQDGSRLFFDSPDPGANRVATTCTGVDATTSCPPQLYVRQAPNGQQAVTRWISRSTVPGQAATLMSKVIFDGASSDGSKVFFRTTAPLTSDDPNAQALGGVDPRPITTGTPSTSSWDLYEYDLPADPAADPADGTLIRISGGPTGDSDPQAGNTAGSVEPVRSVSADGSRVYFVTAKPLDGVAAPTDGTSTSAALSGTVANPTAMNLYLFDASKSGAARWEFIAKVPYTSSGNDTAIGSCATAGAVPGPVLGGANTGVQALAGSNCVRASSDGRLVTFMTAGQLVADDGDAAVDLYTYDQRADTLQRISGPQGVGGASASYPCTTDGGGTLGCNADIGFLSAVIGTPQANVVDDGTGHPAVVFESKRRLLPEAPDGIYSVYAWRDGTLSLIAAGTDEGAAYYSGSSADGRDVFVETRRALAWNDVDGQMDIYDARIGGGFAAPPDRPSQCVGDGCQGPATPAPASPVPQSSLLVGPGNVITPMPPVTKPAKPKVTKPETARGTQGSLRVTLSGKGSLKTSGSGLSRTSRSIARAGAYTVKVKLSRRAAATLKRKGRFVTTARVTFTPSGGTPSSVSARLTFERASRAKPQPQHMRAALRVVETDNEAGR